MKQPKVGDKYQKIVYQSNLSAERRLKVWVSEPALDKQSSLQVRRLYIRKMLVGHRGLIRKKKNASGIFVTLRVIGKTTNLPNIKVRTDKVPSQVPRLLNEIVITDVE